MRLIPKPRPGEYPPYASMYLDLLPDDGRLLRHLRDGLQGARYSEGAQRMIDR